MRLRRKPIAVRDEPRGSSSERSGAGRPYQALAVSLVLHLLAVLAAFWLPFERVQEPRIEEPPIEVVFLDLERTPPVLEQPVPPPPPPAVAARAEPVARDSPADGQPAGAPAPAQRAEPGPEIEEVGGESATIDPADYLEQARSSAEAARGSETPPRPPAPTGAAESPRLDLDQALREFGRGPAPIPPARPAPTGPPQSAPPAGAPTLSPSGVAVGFGMGELVFESTDFDWNDYGRQIHALIWRAWHWRLYHTTNEFDRWAFASGRWYLDHALRIRFVIERSGEITGIVLESGSGCGPLDRSAADALTEVTLPPLPAAFPREREVIHARFIATGDIRDMRPYLLYLHRSGGIP
jgi:hypothetical protein